MDTNTAQIHAIQNFKGAYPKQLLFLSFTEMWERFCFYGNRAMLSLFMVEQLGYSDKDSNLRYGAIQAFVYAFTFLGGFAADKVLGFKRSLVWGGILMILGSLILGIDAQKFFYVGVCLIIVGTGFFKPNISTMVGNLYKDGDIRRDAGFSLFYMAINIGAFLGGVVCIYIKVKWDWNSAFLASGIVMIIGLVVFILLKNTLGPIGNPPIISSQNNTKAKQNNNLWQYIVYGVSILILPVIYYMITHQTLTNWFMYIIGPVALGYLILEIVLAKSHEQKPMIAALIFIFFSIIFWAFFEQSGGSLNLFANKNLNHDLLGFNVNPLMINNSSNSFFVITFSALVGLIWLYLAKKNKEPNAVIKFGLAFLFLALAFYIFYSTRFTANSKGIASLSIFTLGYFVITFGELCISPIGLSLMTKLTPKRLAGVMMGMWFLASAYGQYVAGLLGAGMSEPDKNASNLKKLLTYTDGYKQLAIYALIAGIILIILSPFIKKLMKTTQPESNNEINEIGKII